MKRILDTIVMVLALAALFAGSAQAQQPFMDPRPGCDSCLIKISPEITEPFKGQSLAGTWLFTQEDDFLNSDPMTDTSNWSLVHAPGSWVGASKDGQRSRIGWYRGVIEWQPEQIAKEWVILISSKLARVTVYIDGDEVYNRPGNFSIERFYANQPIPIQLQPKFGKTVIAFRVESLNEDGVYELPFEVRRYNTLDNTLTWNQFRGGELRLLVGFASIFFGLFFFLVYGKIRQRMYLAAALGSVTAAPYLIIPTDVMLRTFEPEPLVFLQFIGQASVYFYFRFCQHFDKTHKSLNWIMAALSLGAILPICYMAFIPPEEVNLALFENLRRMLFFVNLTMIAVSLYHTIRGVMNKHDGAVVLFLGMLGFAAITVHDALMVIGVIDSTGLVPLDNIVFLGAMIYVASSSFARTFKDNERLVTDLKGINDNLEQIVSERTAQLREKTNDIQNMLQNMPQGILTIVADGTVHPEYSRYMEDIFETQRIAGVAALQLLFADSDVGSDALSQVEATIASCIGEDRMNFDFNAHLLVTDVAKTLPGGRIKYLDLNWSPICDDADTVDKLMVCVRDVTELRRLEAEAGQQKRELEMIGQILTVNQEKFHEFVDSARNFVAENETLLKSADDKHPELVTQLFRNMHTIKGNARTYGLLHLTNVVHEAEQAYDDLRKNPDMTFEKEALLAQLQDVMRNIEEYASLNEVKLGRKGPGRRGSAEKYVMVRREQVEQMVADLDQVDHKDPVALGHVVAKTQLGLRLIGTESIQNILDGVFASLPALARELGKEVPQLTVTDNGVFIRNQIADLLRNVFMHLYRNSLDHGLESADERVAKGKPPAGRISLDLRIVGDELRLRMVDDGRGLALAYIHAKGVEKGLIADEAGLPDADIAQLIFAPGFSTATVVTEISGRGVGMDAVQDFVKREGGNIALHFTDTLSGADFRAFETVITMPAHFAVASR